jgi:hypothetical protein
MSRISRFAVLVTALASLCGVLASAAGAVTWTNDGSVNFTATGGATTLSVTSSAFACTGSDGAGTAPASATTATYLISGTMTYTGCGFAGQIFTVDCGFAFTATTVVQPIVTGDLDMTCGFYMSNTKLCHLEGGAHAQYTNETGTLTVTTSTSMRFTGVSCPFGPNDLVHRTVLDFRVSSATPPTVTRAA